jgi:Ca2+/Na+ antiporter
MSSILVARDGFGDMAVSNAIGSNVFDINLGLGLPFLIRILIDKGKAFSLLSSTQQEMYQAGLYTILPHPKFGLLLLVVVLTILVMLSIIRCRLNKITGLFLVFIYALFLGYAFTQELVCLQGVYC